MKLYNVYYSLEGEVIDFTMLMVGKDESEARHNALYFITSDDPACVPKIIKTEEIKKDDAKDLY